MKSTISSKKGVASMFVVIFTALLFSIIALGFVNIMLSEANQTTNYDLSQSAYDSALAGIEDAKIAILEYQDCLRQGATTKTGSEECQNAITAMSAPAASVDCDIISKILNRPGTMGEETTIQSGSNDASGEVMNQAYTCVLMTDVTEDYLGSMSQSSRAKIVPIRAIGVDKISRMKLQWYNSTDTNKVGAADAASFDRTLGAGSLSTNKKGYDDHNIYKPTSSSGNRFSDKPQAPPTIQFQLIQTANSFSIDQLETNSGANTNRGFLMLRPSTTTNSTIGNSSAVGLASSADRSFNNPVDVNCTNTTSGYLCEVDIIIPAPIGGVRTNDNTLVRLILPYGAPDTSFKLTMYNDKGELIEFDGVQTRVDSTGRANDLFRRVEARIELFDNFFPFPEFALDLGDPDAQPLLKDFWVTKNCWGECKNSGEVKTTN